MPDLRDLRGRPIGRTNGDPRTTAGRGNDPRPEPGPRPVDHSSAGNGPRPVHRTRAQERIDELDVSPTKLLAEIESLKGELEATQAKADEYLTGLQRERAEFNNFRRRTTEEREQMLGLAGEDLIRKVLAIADDFDLAIDNRPTELAGDGWVEGVTAIDRKLRLLLDSEGVTEIDAAAGARFDPREHEAIANVPGTGRAEGEIVDVVRRVAAGDVATDPATGDAAPTN
jgi:molecular chaperone GrpE